MRRIMSMHTESLPSYLDFALTCHDTVNIALTDG
jgi:hypothetical protein